MIIVIILLFIIYCITIINIIYTLWAKPTMNPYNIGKLHQNTLSSFRTSPLPAGTHWKAHCPIT